MIKFDSNEAFDQAVKSGEQLLLLKHSSTCPVSGAAYEEYESFANEHKDLNIYYLVVQEDRPLSNHIAETFHIKHESPQAILFNNGDVAWHASHWKITYDSLQKALDENK
ncbi:bacillithiol system redox-active protein YtxJ [Bacillus sp. ISL-47]|uniref:bacillithiol system redox-active protein YtxJ n=1 Tax=Bacillus sp. ISL-47 TaxID=2819130 RepID=UPI001BEA17E0|nr:bacillithiol system redox-active protein YtxJ [Bacillus sp. ISL-47]MBT2691176.1 bacillithiol system redox-active protein YtxJ [Bacillus sp. ISL-47]MBT2710322.1 bacillithiol system redox-active protein YtxJ [Pseudomonas sp. ISL-84]